MMKRPCWIGLLLTLTVPFVSQGGVYLMLSWIGIAQQDYSNVLINTVFLAACIVLIRALDLSAQDVGLRIVPDRLPWHLTTCLGIFVFYMLSYIFAVRISGPRPLSSKIGWGLLNYLVVAFAEEIYFRGIFYGVIQKRYSDRAALAISTLLFGLVHVRQGLGMLPKFFTGWLWGTVRYSTQMIFLLIIPIHFAYNAVWLLFEGKWDSLPTWAQFFPLVELILGLMILGAQARLFRSQPVAPLRSDLNEPSTRHSR